MNHFAGRVVARYEAAIRVGCAVSWVLLAACATAPAQMAFAPNTAVEQAATAPLTDLNLARERIPPVLLRAQADPYGSPADLSCASLRNEIVALDASLPVDVDVQGAAQRDGTTFTFTPEDAAVYAIQGAVGGIIPFRSWVRKLTGAERQSKALTRALASGMAKRSYLKGYARSTGCSWPMPQSDVVVCQSLSSSDKCSAPAAPDPALPPSSDAPPAR